MTAETVQSEVLKLTIEQAGAAELEARKSLGKIDAAIREEKAKAAAEVDERFRTQRRAALDVVRARERDVLDAKDRLPPHEWEGKKVFSMRRVGRAWEQRTERVEGVVETRRSDAEFPANMTWLPQVGEAFIRLLKKDGTPSLRFERWSRGDWKLVEAEAQ